MSNNTSVQPTGCSVKQHCVCVCVVRMPYDVFMLHLIHAGMWCLLLCMFLPFYMLLLWFLIWVMSTLCVARRSSVLLQQLKPVLGVVRAGVPSINSPAVICEKHQVLPRNKDKNKTKDMWCSCSSVKTWLLKQTQAHTHWSAYPIADSGDDGVEVLDFAFQQHHPGSLPAVLVGMVQHHVKEVPELGGDAGVLERSILKNDPQ